MILLFEGVNGVGKTTYIRQVEKRTGWPSYSAFRGVADKYDSSMLDELARLGIPVNTFIDEMYMADLVRATGINLIVDRSFPSAVAYDEVFDQGTFVDREATEKIWLDLVKEAGMLYVWLCAPYEVTRIRSTGVRLNRQEHFYLEEHFRKWYEKIPTEKLMIDTGAINVASGVNRICRALKK
jgi:thymidylate kinase